MNAKAMVIQKFGEPLILTDVPIPKLHKGEALVRILASGICGSDVHIWQGEDIRTHTPLTPGHEGIGELVESNGDLSDINGAPVRPGDRLTWERGIACGTCHACVVMRDPALCLNRRTYGIHVPFDEPPHLNGCYATHIVLRKGAKLISLQNWTDIDPAILVPAVCSGATTAHAFDLSRPKPGDVAVIQGPGPLGIFAVDFARRSGASEIVVIGRKSLRTEVCTQLGATKILDRAATTAEERREEILALTGGRGADWVYECAGTNPAVAEALTLARRGADVLTSGIAVPTGEIPVDWFRTVMLKNLRIQGVWLSDTPHLRMSLSLVRRSPEIYARLITHRYPLAEATEALRAVQRGETVKAVIA